MTICIMESTSCCTSNMKHGALFWSCISLLVSLLQWHLEISILLLCITNSNDYSSKVIIILVEWNEWINYSPVIWRHIKGTLSWRVGFSLFIYRPWNNWRSKTDPTGSLRHHLKHKILVQKNKNERGGMGLDERRCFK